MIYMIYKIDKELRNAYFILKMNPVNRIAAERRKFCSPRREPWVNRVIDTSAAERRDMTSITMSRPSGAARSCRSWSHGLRHGLQI